MFHLLQELFSDLMQQSYSQLNRLLLFTAVTCTLCYHFVFGENDTFIPIRIDGVNTVLFNQEYPNRSLNMYSIIWGNPVDQFPFNLLSDYAKPYDNIYESLKDTIIDSLFHLQASARAGAETGESMMNRFEGLAEENRDHFTTFATACRFPKTPMNLFFGYRYIDTYSDRFDAKWEKYKNITGDNMSFSEEGLAHELVSGYSLSCPIAATTLKTISYNRWGATPYYFSPLLSRGYALYPSLIFILPKSKIYVDFLFDYHKDYYNHIDYSEYTDEGWDITWQRQLKKGIIAQLSHHINSKLDPSAYANAMLHDTISNLFIWSFSGNLYSNFRMGGSLDINYIQIPKFSLNVNAAWDFIPQTRSYTFWENKTPVEYHTIKYEVASLHTSLNYTDTLFFPVKASVWLNYCEKPLWETIEYTNNKIIIRQDTIYNAAHLTSGGKVSYKISLKKFFLTLWGNAEITPKERELHFSLPRDLGADLGYGSTDNDSLYAVIRFETRDGCTLKYMNESSNEIKEYTAPAQTSISFLFKIPFFLPFLKEHLRTNFQIEAGPIRLSKEQRIKEHPKGNLIGPAISLGFNGFIN